mgnify:CR=1 FL=1
MNTEADSKTELPNEIPTLTRSMTVGGTQFTVPDDFVEAKVDGVTVKVSRSATSTQYLDDILDDFPDSIKEIVAASIQKKKE